MKNAINLLPPIYRRQRLAHRRLVEWSAVLCATLSILFVARSYKAREYRAISEQLAAVSREGRPAQVMLKEITAMRQQIQQLQRHQAVAEEFEQQRHALALLGAVSRAAQQTQGRLRVTDCRVVDLQTTNTGTSEDSQMSPAGTVTLIGVSLDSPTVAEFHEGLLRSGLFADVKLIRSNERDDAGPTLFDYEVRCEL